MSKPTIIPNWHYQKTTKGGYRSLRKLLKYVSYRESPDHRPVDLSDRWTDCGLGQAGRRCMRGQGSKRDRMCWRITWSSPRHLT